MRGKIVTFHAGDLGMLIGEVVELIDDEVHVQVNGFPFLVRVPTEQMKVFGEEE